MENNNNLKTSVVVIGAGPAGLTAAYLLAKQGKLVIVVETDEKYVGGISKTIDYKGYYSDIGGHRFYSKSKAVEDLWTELLEKDLIVRKRVSRIFYKGKFYSYPLRPFEAFFNLGPIETMLCISSFLWAQLFPVKNATNLEDWVSNQFGKRLFQIFFKTYTEKVWGMKCKDISADWAAQRIGKLSLGSAIINSFRTLSPFKKSKTKIKTLIDEFRYPRKGPGMMWDVCSEKIQKMGGLVYMGYKASHFQFDKTNSLWTVRITKEQDVKEINAEHVISSAPLGEVIHALSPVPNKDVMSAASKLHYRDFICVGVILKDKVNLPDQWIYIHDSSVQVGRIQNFKSWSPEMVPDPNMTCYSLEYFCFKGDGLWEMPDKDLVKLAQQELVKLGLAHEADIKDGFVIRQPKAYPVYDDVYKDCVDLIRKTVDSDYPHLHFVGRNGMHKYNNQDHAMMTAMLTVQNIISGSDSFDPWNVNQDAEYIEEAEQNSNQSSGLRDVPKSIRPKT
ncbi:MAG: NAD(P)/FAD-dependent oxidoreductase [Elusimicrobiota bacterium]